MAIIIQLLLQHVIDNNLQKKSNKSNTIPITEQRNGKLAQMKHLSLMEVKEIPYFTSYLKYIQIRPK